MMEFFALGFSAGAAIGVTLSALFRGCAVINLEDEFAAALEAEKQQRIDAESRVKSLEDVNHHLREERAEALHAFWRCEGERKMLEYRVAMLQPLFTPEVEDK